MEGPHNHCSLFFVYTGFSRWIEFSSRIRKIRTKSVCLYSAVKKYEREVNLTSVTNGNGPSVTGRQLLFVLIVPRVTGSCRPYLYDYYFYSQKKKKTSSKNRKLQINVKLRLALQYVTNVKPFEDKTL